MWTLRRSLAIAGLAAGVSSLNLFCIQAEDSTADADNQVNQVKQLLQREAQGQAVDRRVAVGEAPRDDWAGWQAGLLKDSSGWQAPDRLNDSSADRVYQKKRDELGQDPEANLKLARWCKDNHREELARAHYFAILANDPNHVESRKYLGHVQYGGEWVDAHELKAKQQAVRNELEALDKWTGRLKPILQSLSSTKTKDVSAGLNRLDAIDSDEALPALILATMKVEDELALPLVRKISKMRSPAACLGLVRIACTHPSAKARDLAMKGVKEYPLEMFVPGLLGQLASDITVENQMVMQPNGNVSLQTVVKQELKDKRIHQTFEKSVNTLSTFFSRHDTRQIQNDVKDTYVWSIRRGIPKSNPVHEGEQVTQSRVTSSIAAAAGAYVPPEVAQSVSQNLQEQGQLKKLEADQLNRAADEKLAPVYDLLRQTTSQTFGDDPSLWWDWWTEYNERYRSGLKPVQKSYASTSERLPLDSRSYQSTLAGVYKRDLGKVLVQKSCLVAGTVVQTSTGLQAIEKIQVGDRVMCQDPETGELSLQPVLLTTVRPPNSTLKIVTEKETIQATGGHLWWVSGKGWTKTRDLQPDTYLHSATGNVRIKEVVEVSQPVPTYNLVVDRHHTYFVGNERILSYDNTPVKPTLLKLPGYVTQ